MKKLDFRRIEQYSLIIDKYVEVFSKMLDTSDFISPSIQEKISNAIYKDMKSQFVEVESYFRAERFRKTIIRLKNNLRLLFGKNKQKKVIK